MGLDLNQDLDSNLALEKDFERSEEGGGLLIKPGSGRALGVSIFQRGVRLAKLPWVVGHHL